ncbi:hypothetical protein RJ640_009806 [Escallonia rubra]|uniref:Activator of Hsp90 ATPase AHSA1-like N-terminal domain-containing protein n=1 Tax=Escallonia rubra TaxID=112253 RepID=A0AA88R047_9ASTE|nr:hypothetical protein RJ640_009806 [Escallonia rubra]
MSIKSIPQQTAKDLKLKQTTKVEKVEGEAYVNVRKGKIIPSYEISLTLGWAGEAKMPPATRS